MISFISAQNSRLLRARPRSEISWRKSGGRASHSRTGQTAGRGWLPSHEAVIGSRLGAMGGWCTRSGDRQALRPCALAPPLPIEARGMAPLAGEGWSGSWSGFRKRRKTIMSRSTHRACPAWGHGDLPRVDSHAFGLPRWSWEAFSRCREVTGDHSGRHGRSTPILLSSTHFHIP